MQDGRKVVWSIPYVSVAFFSSLKQNFIAYLSSKVSSCPDCIFEIHQLWQSGFNRMYSNSCCRCSFESEIIKIGQSSHKMYSNNIVNFQESMSILNACTKKSGNLLKAPRISEHISGHCYWLYISYVKGGASLKYSGMCAKTKVLRIFQCPKNYGKLLTKQRNSQEGQFKS